MDFELIEKYFPGTEISKIEKLKMLREVYLEWNSKINVISRKDTDSLYLKHVLHSLAIAKFVSFKPGTKILDVGTGGGFPGIPLSIMFPESEFHLVDSIGKKIKVVSEVANYLNLTNVTAQQERVENLKKKYHFVVSRAVTAMPELMKWVHDKIDKDHFNAIPNGFIFLKGGDLKSELGKHKNTAIITDLKEYFEEEFYETKKIVYLPRY